jgi:RES domain-containing protein
LTNALLYWALLHAWAFVPLSGDGAAQHGDRWNRERMKALYLAADPMTAVAEYSQDLQFRPVTLAQYHLSEAQIIDLTDHNCLIEHALMDEIHAVAWRALTLQGSDPPQWPVADRLIAAGWHGAWFPPATSAQGRSIVLWRWNGTGGCKLQVIDQDNRLPLDQSSWKRCQLID